MFLVEHGDKIVRNSVDYLLLIHGNTKSAPTLKRGTKSKKKTTTKNNNNKKAKTSNTHTLCSKTAPTKAKPTTEEMKNYAIITRAKSKDR